jgi:hypothetical protein
MVRDPVEDPLQALAEGRVPELSALTLHNGTVWRWNRPCYGITDGKPHLRIENRALPAGPTIVDQVANVALYYGLMQALAPEAGDIPRQIAFEDARLNLFAAAQHGLAARFTWPGGQRLGAAELLLNDLLPTAADGLTQRPDRRALAAGLAGECAGRQARGGMQTGGRDRASTPGSLHPGASMGTGYARAG